VDFNNKDSDSIIKLASYPVHLDGDSVLMNPAPNVYGYYKLLIIYFCKYQAKLLAFLIYERVIGNFSTEGVPSIR